MSPALTVRGGYNYTQCLQQRRERAELLQQLRARPRIAGKDTDVRVVARRAVRAPLL